MEKSAPAPPASYAPQTTSPKKVSIISFTKEGGNLSRRILHYLRQNQFLCTGYQKTSSAEKPFPGQTSAPSVPLLPVPYSLTQWTGEQFSSVDILIFVGAAGIAVRALAPWVKDKFQDPAVLVMDEQGTFVIPLLSGHMGGANAYARMLAAAFQALPVITTATDLHQCFAVDVFAREHGLWITDRKLAKQMSAEALRGNPIGVFSDIPVNAEELPGCTLNIPGCINLYLGIWKPEKWPPNVPRKHTLQLVPPCLTLGIGCRKNIAQDVLTLQVNEGLEEWGIWPQAVRKAATITLKKEEKALHELCRERQWELCWFSPEELMQAEGEFSYSAFVQQTTGADNVCERAAVLGAGAPLLFPKTIKKGVTLAAAQTALVKG